MIGGFQPVAFQTDFQQGAYVPVSADAGRRRRVRSIYRIAVDGVKFEFATLRDALLFLDSVKAKAQALATEAVQAPEAVLPPAPKIEVSSRELRAAASLVRREVAETFRQALRDSEIRMLLELKKRKEDDDDTLLLLM